MPEILNVGKSHLTMIILSYIDNTLVAVTHAGRLRAGRYLLVGLVGLAHLLAYLIQNCKLFCEPSDSCDNDISFLKANKSG